MRRWSIARTIVGVACISMVACAAEPSALELDSGDPDASAFDAGVIDDPDVGTAIDATFDSSDDDAIATPDASVVLDGSTDPFEMVVGAWNLHHFSPYGTTEFRLDAIATQIDTLGVDVLGVEELQVATDSEGTGPQAWDALLERLPGYEGIHNPWNTFDSTVGLLVRSENARVLGWETIFEDDRSAFPRPPLDANIEIRRGDRVVSFHVMIVHLKAFADSVERRRAACSRIVEYVAAMPERRYVIIGDFNDDPYDAADVNSFTSTFLGNEPTWFFATESLPPETVTSTGFYHEVDGVRLTGEFLDHAIVSGELHSLFESVVPEVVARPEADFSVWERDYSDHFPILVHFTGD